MNADQAKARLFDIERRSQILIERIQTAARAVRETVLAMSDVTAPAFSAPNVPAIAGIMLEKASLLAADGIDARDELRALSQEKDRLYHFICTLGEQQ